MPTEMPTPANKYEFIKIKNSYKGDGERNNIVK